jgi:hypothetical protein
VSAVVESTLPSEGSNVRQLAFDDDPDTFFASERDARADDHVTLTFDKPVAVVSVSVVTGKPDGTRALDSGTLGVSADGTSFERLATFHKGKARGEVHGRLLRAVRVSTGGDLGHALIVREVEVESTPAVKTFKYPVEFVLDVSDAPEMKAWAEKAARACEQAYPMINEELRSDGYTPPRRITMALKADYKGVAMTSGDRITGSVAFFKQHPDDIGAMVHETVHVVQGYRSRKNPSWLVEGVADYVRFFKYEPGNLGPIDPRRARYDRSYRVTAAFLASVTERYDKQLVLKLNRMMREGTYEGSAFEKLTGKPLATLDEEWRVTLRP